MQDKETGRIGIFDSGYGGLTILEGIRKVIPEYDYLYLGDNARAPYGSRSFDIVYEFTRDALEELFRRGCRLVILACNTASAKALRSIQQHVLPLTYPDRRVLGVIRPTVEILGEYTHTGHIGLVATPGTVRSHSYRMEIEKLYPEMRITEQACPMWVPLVENNEATKPGADYFVKKYINEIMAADPLIDTIVLGCTHYPILLPKIKKYVPENVRIVVQGEIVADSLKDYLHRHPELECRCTKAGRDRNPEKGGVNSGNVEYLTTENPEDFNRFASLLLNDNVNSSRIIL
ncbi:MAG: glutamate racemase [Candidatus Amulumruptor caecigallinarius]|nr:glutamate racemase [Candidatus Amulumruptor caecigallinarius]